MRILAFACACVPGTGSEAGAGWVWSQMLADIGETWVLTRTKHRPEIEAALPRIRTAHPLHFVFIEGRGAAVIQKGQRNLRLNYLLWQIAALKEARSLQERIGFDLVWHLTWANVWLGTTAHLVRGPRFVYGPVGGGVGTPWRLIGSLGSKGALAEVARAAGKAAGRYLHPWARGAWRRADLILTQNPDTSAWFPESHRAKAVVFPHVVVDAEIGKLRQPPRCERTVLFAGRLLPWKGMALLLRAVKQAPGLHLLVAGDGPDRQRLERLAERLDISQRVSFMGWLPHDRLLDVMRTEADVFALPSLHDEAGWVVVEAMAAGLPVVALDRGGPPVLGAVGVETSGLRATVAALARALTGDLAHETPTRYERKTASELLREQLGRCGLT